MRIGIVGCGFTADHYMISLSRFPELQIVGGTDRVVERGAAFCSWFKMKHYKGLAEMLADPGIEMVLNLTSSSSHYEVSKAALEAGKHLYSEKPLALEFEQAQELVDLAKAGGLGLSMAPCNLLSESAQTMWQALRKGEIGSVHVALAELNDGPFHMADSHNWRADSGAPYDYREEFRVGVTVEHAGYHLSLLSAFFGPAKSITAFSSVVWPDRPISPEERLSLTTPDFTVSCITFESGVVARLTCSLVAPYNHVLQLVGDTGTMTVHEPWNYRSPIYVDRYSSFRYRAERYLIAQEHPFIKGLVGKRPRLYPSVVKTKVKERYARYRMVYARGVADLVRAIDQQRPATLSPNFCLHLTELALAIQKADPGPYQVKTTFAPLQPLDEAAMRELVK
ncbi:MAG TPA: Gfo/Idh/MocA family oxidoreductase [Acidobacteriaceae bacterium]|nr:Gfo/Idh/MocA family oxidoreductase [Acidobacteriaceae bacterium]